MIAVFEENWKVDKDKVGKTRRHGIPRHLAA
jgi:hypothetical protein